MEKRNTENLRVMVIAPGALTSTFDVFNYSMDGLRKNLDEARVLGFSTHNMLLYHCSAYEDLYPEMSQTSVVRSATTRVALDIIAEVYVKRPDVIHIIDGTIFPLQMLRELERFRQETRREFLISIHLTEEPYASEHSKNMVKHIDLVFANDKSAVRELNGDGSKHIYYFPHSYCEDVHYSSRLEDKDTDVFFCGALYPERERLFDAVDWSGLNVKLVGSYGDSEMPERLSSVMESGTLLNTEVAGWYRRSRIAINKHREKGLVDGVIEAGRAYSVNPRVIEAAACGAFQLSDYREELVDLFGDSVAVYSDADDLSMKIRYYLEHEEERNSMASRAKEIVQGMSYTDRSKFMIEKMIEAHEQVGLQRFGGISNG